MTDSAENWMRQCIQYVGVGTKLIPVLSHVNFLKSVLRGRLVFRLFSEAGITIFHYRRLCFIMKILHFTNNRKFGQYMIFYPACIL